MTLRSQVNEYLQMYYITLKYIDQQTLIVYIFIIIHKTYFKI